MSHQEMIALKLQMGINPLAKISPNVLLAMWQQLKIESSQLQPDTSNAISNPRQKTSGSIVL